MTRVFFPSSLVRMIRTSNGLSTGSPAYHALSWTWGKGKSDHLIFISKLEFYIPATLYDALLHLRTDNAFRHPSLLLWIDLICINQASEDEKNIQVARPRETYQAACKVIVWLGDRPEKRESTGWAASFLADHIHDLNGPIPTYFCNLENAAHNAHNRPGHFAAAVVVADVGNPGGRPGAICRHLPSVTATTSIGNTCCTRSTGAKLSIWNL